MPHRQTAPADYRELMKKIERTVGEIHAADRIGETIRSVLDGVVGDLREDLGLEGGRVYRREGKDYVLQTTFGRAKTLPEGLRVPRTYPPIDLCCARGAVYIEADDPLIDPDFEKELGVQEFACIEVGDEEFILAFNVAPGYNRDDILFSLGILRHSINQKIRQERMQEIFHEARRIQASILPRRIPRYGNFDIYGHSVPMESVGGDFYDYIPITDKVLGLAIADVSGHGLPAALQVRDIYMGLRMGMARDLKIVRTVERLNRIIHRSTLTSRFVSMFYGELELNGNFIYVNAGHPPPFRLSADGSYQEMTEGGVVLGPLADSTYERGFHKLQPGDMVVMYTDGIIETRGWPENSDPSSSATMEEYGRERLLELARRHQGKPAQAVVDAVFASIDEFSGGRPQKDDRTVLVVTYPS